MKTKITGALVACLLLSACNEQELPFEPPADFLSEKNADEPFLNGASSLSVAPLTIHTPDAEHRDAYPRVIQLANGDLLASFVYALSEGYGNNIVKIYRSTNGGASWTWISDLSDTHRGQGCSDPQLLEMPVAMGSVPAGTLICGVRSMFWVSESYIDLYRSDDGGVTWAFMSTVASGQGWESNVYEPHFVIDTSGRLLCYYADERDNTSHSQKLVYRASTDGGYTWAPQVDVVALSAQSARPGMPQIARMGNGQFMLVYEYAWHPTPGIVSPIHYKLSADGFNWGPVTDPGTMITGADGTIPGVSPSVMWTPAGSPKGTVVVTASRNNPGSSRGSDNFVNYNYGAGPWYRVQQPLPYTHGVAGAGYSRSVTPSADGSTLFHINCVDFTSINAKTMFAATPAAFTPGHTYKILNKNSNKMLGIKGGSTDDFAKAAQGAENYALDQEWMITASGTGSYVKIINKKSGKALDIAYGSTANGAHAIQWPSSAATSQLWEMIPAGDGFYKLENANSGKLLRVIDCATGQGIIADQWADNGATCQRWQLQHIQ